MYHPARVPSGRRTTPPLYVYHPARVPPGPRTIRTAYHPIRNPARVPQGARTARTTVPFWLKRKQNLPRPESNMCCRRRKEGRLGHHPEAQEEEIEDPQEADGVFIWQHLTRKILKRAFQKRVWASLGHFLNEAKREARGQEGGTTSENQEPRGAYRRR